MSNGLRIAGAVALTTALAACGRNSAPVPSAKPSSAPAAPASVVATAATTLASTLDVSATPKARPVTPTLEVPRAPKAITPSSEFDVQVWGNAVNTHTLLDDAGKGAVPVSESRFLWGQQQLYLAFYAGDLDLEMREKKHDGPVWKDDSMSVSFFVSGQKKRTLVVSPLGVLADGICPADAADLSDARCDLRWESHARFAVDADGTVNKLGDFDEEWTVELAIPLASFEAKPVPGTELAFSLKRCDMAFDGKRAFGAWGSNEHPAKLVLQ